MTAWEALGRASWRVKAALIALVLAKLHGMAAIVAVLGVTASPALRPLAVFLMVAHATCVAAALGLAGWEWLAQKG